MALSFEEISDKSLKRCKLVKKLTMLLHEYNRKVAKVCERVSENEIANLYKLLSHFDIVLNAVTQKHLESKDVQRLRFRYQSQIGEEWYNIYHIYQSYTADPHYSIDELMYFARQANQSYLPRVLSDTNSPIADKCQQLHPWLDRLHEIKQKRRKDESTNKIIEEITVREEISKHCSHLLMDPMIYGRYEKDLFRTMNQQALIIVKLMHKFPDIVNHEFKCRLERDIFLSNIVHHLSLWRYKQDPMNALQSFSDVLKQELKDYEVNCLDGTTQTCKISWQPSSHTQSVVLSPFVVPRSYVEHAYNNNCFNAYAKLTAVGMESIMAEDYGQLCLHVDNQNYYYVEIRAAYPYELQGYLRDLNSRSVDDEHLTILTYAKKIIDKLNLLNQEGIYYDNVKSSHVLLDQWGDVHFSHVDALVDAAGQRTMNTSKILSFYHNNNDVTSVDLAEYQNLSLGLSLYQLTHDVHDVVQLKDLKLNQNGHDKTVCQLDHVIEQLVYPEKSKATLPTISEKIAEYIKDEFSENGTSVAINDNLYYDSRQPHLEMPPPRQQQETKKRKRKR